MLAGAGDELQGIKRGIMELADAILITKCDEANELNAKNIEMEIVKKSKLIINLIFFFIIYQSS